MTRPRQSSWVLSFMGALLPVVALAQNVVSFSTSDRGVRKAITEWGVEVAWVSADNIRHSKAHMGEDEIDVIFANFYTEEALQPNGEIGPKSKKWIDAQVEVAAALPKADWGLGPSVFSTDPYFYDGKALSTDRWVALIKATKEYYEKAHHKTIRHVMPFNEPDYWKNQGTVEDMRDILLLLEKDPAFKAVGLMGPSTLNSDPAIAWYDKASGPITHGTTHQLAGSADSFVNFYRHVVAKGDIGYNPELHSMAEAIFSAEYGVTGGAWWGAVMRPRGVFVRACQGRRLGYAENRANQAAAAVYRGPDGEVYGFAGCFERQGALTPFRFVCTDRDVYYNGVGPVREFMLPVNQAQDAYVDIDFDKPIMPALDGNRWKIINRVSGLALTVTGAGVDDGADIHQAPDTDAPNQKWDIIRNRDGYYRIFNAKSGRTAEVADWSLADGADVRQWGKGDNFLQHWFIEDAKGGYYYIRNAHSDKHMTGDDVKIYQSKGAAQNNQWKFVPANPAKSGKLVLHYEFEGNTNDSIGSRDGVVSGTPSYQNGPRGRAVKLDGKGNFVTLPAGVGSLHDLTIATWVKWNGGKEWQRIFDFGTGPGSYMMLTPSSSGKLLRFSITTGGNEKEEFLETDPLPVGKWVHVAVTLRGNMGMVYIDGKPKVAGQILADPAAFTPPTNYIGKSQWPDPLFDGQIGDFRIYDYALPADEISRLHSKE